MGKECCILRSVIGPALQVSVASPVFQSPFYSTVGCLTCIRKWSSVYRTFFIWKNYQTILLFFFTHTYSTKTGSTEWVAVNEDKEIGLEGSRIIRDLDSQAEQFKCETGNRTVTFFCLSSSFKGK